MIALAEKAFTARVAELDAHVRTVGDTVLSMLPEFARELRGVLGAEEAIVYRLFEDDGGLALGFMHGSGALEIRPIMALWQDSPGPA